MKLIRVLAFIIALPLCLGLFSCAGGSDSLGRSTDGTGGGGGGSTGGGGGTTSNGFLLISDTANDKLLVQSIATDGTLTPGNSIATGADPLTIVRSGSTVFVANSGSTNVSAFNFSSSGALTTIGIGPFAAGLNPIAMAVAPSGTFLVVANQGSNNLSLEQIDTSGGLTQLNTASVNGSPRAMAFLSGILFVASTTELRGFRITNTNSIAPDPTAVASPNLIALVATPQLLIGIDGVTDSLLVFSADATTGELIAMGSLVPAAVDLVSAVADSTGKFLFVVDALGETVLVFSINTITGALTAVGTPVSTGGTSPGPMAFDSVNSLLFVANTGSKTIQVFKVSTGGTLTAVGTPVSVAGTISAMTVVRP